MDTSKFTKSKFLRATDFALGTRLKRTVERAEEVEFDNGAKLALKFVREDQPLTLNRAQLTAMQEFFGMDADDWIGKRIELQVIPAMFQGKPTRTFLINDMTMPTSMAHAGEERVLADADNPF